MIAAVDNVCCGADVYQAAHCCLYSGVPKDWAQMAATGADGTEYGRATKLKRIARWQGDSHIHIWMRR